MCMCVIGRENCCLHTCVCVCGGCSFKSLWLHDKLQVISFILLKPLEWEGTTNREKSQVEQDEKVYHYIQQQSVLMPVGQS